MKEIAVNNGMLSKVDDWHYERLAVFHWMALRDNKSGLWYAGRNAQKSSGGKIIWMHREVLGIPPKDPREVDHREAFDTLNNQESNLRLATRCQNNANRRLFKNNTSGYRGVYPTGFGRWYVVSWFDGKKKHLGTFDDPKVGYEAFCEEKRRIFGEFARVE